MANQEDWAGQKAWDTVQPIPSLFRTRPKVFCILASGMNWILWMEEKLGLVNQEEEGTEEEEQHQQQHDRRKGWEEWRQEEGEEEEKEEK